MTEETGRYRTPGELVQAAREARGLSIRDLADETRIPLRMIEAIEADDFAEISNPLYARSFLKTIGEELRLDIDLLLERYDRLTEPDEVATETQEEQTWETETKVLNTETMAWRTPVSVVGVLAVVVLLIWGAVKIFSGPGDDPADKARLDDAGSPGTEQVVAVSPDTTYAVAIEEFLDIPEAAPGLEFQGIGVCNHVLRLMTMMRVEITVILDDEEAPVVIDWEDTSPAVPESDIEPGRVYQLGDRRIVYWCAEERFRCMVPDALNLELRYNGRTIDFNPEDLGLERTFSVDTPGG